MEVLFNLLITSFIALFWILANAFNKPVLNRMMNFYEDDKEGRDVANFFVAIMLVLSFILGSRLF